jgi:uncharacterized protein YbaR (Trm112 family)
MTISEKIAHMMGLAEGLAIDTEKSKEGKLIAEMMDIIKDMSAKLDELEEVSDLLNEELDEMSDELMAFEEDYYLDDEDEFDDEDEEYDEDEDEDDENPVYLVSCPVCGAELELDEDTLLGGELRCEACGQLFSLEVVEDDEDEDEAEAEDILE